MTNLEISEVTDGSESVELAKPENFEQSEQIQSEQIELFVQLAEVPWS